MASSFATFKRLKDKGIAALKQGDYVAAKPYLIQAAECMIEMSEENKDSGQRAEQEIYAKELIDLAKDCDRKAKHGAGASPIVLGGLMIVGNDNTEASFLAGLNVKTGKTVWQIKRSSKMTSYITPAVYRPKGGDPEVVFVSEANGMTGIDPVNGQKKWESEKLFTLKSVASPVVAGNVIFATAGKGAGGEESAAVFPGDKQTGRETTVAWTMERDLPYVPTPIAIGGHLYILSDTGVMTCVVSATGKQVWQADLDERFYASPVYVNGRIYVVTRKGEVIVLKAGTVYKVLAKSTLPEISDATPAIANGRMYIRTLNHLICIGDANTKS